jgi:hypothetical protein
MSGTKLLCERDAAQLAVAAARRQVRAFIVVALSAAVGIAVVGAAAVIAVAAQAPPSVMLPGDGASLPDGGTQYSWKATRMR